MHDKVGEFAGRAVHEWLAEVFAATDGPGAVRPVPAHDPRRAGEGRRAGRRTTQIEIRPYTDDEIAAIDEALAGERDRRRGAEPRWWEDVEEGDELGPLVKGPMRVTDMVVWHTGMGMGLYGVKALRLGYDQRQRMPRFFKPDALNIPDVQQRVHWDPEWARAAGNPASYDYGRMRETWLIHLCTDWMGDDAWLWKLDCQFRKFNYVGDTHWMRGRVDPQVPGRRRPAGGRPRHLGREPAGRHHHARATPRSCCRRASTGRSGCPTRRAAPPPARRRSTPWPSGSPPRRPRVKPYPDVPAGLVVEHDGPVLRLRLDRPDRRNSLTDPIVYALVDIVDAAASDESVRVIHLTGTGDHFCSGLRPRPSGHRAGDKPRVGSIHRRMNGHVNRLIPAMLTTQTPIVCTARGLGHRPRPRPRSWPRTSPSWPTTPGCGRRSPRSASRPTAVRPGSSPASPVWPGPRRC